MRKLLLLALIPLFFMSFVSAYSISLNPNSVSETLVQGSSKNITVLYIITNTDNSTINININPSNFPNSLITSSISSIPVGASSTATGSFILSINVPSSTAINTYTGNIYVGSTTIPASVQVTQASNPTPDPSGCSIDIFPTVLTNIRIQQGETKTRSIQLTVPSCFASALNLQGVALQTDEKPILLGELQIGRINPGNSILVPINIDAVSVSTGTYSDVLSFLIYNSSGSRVSTNPVSISVTVTTGINPITNFSFSDLPSCTLSAVEFAVNGTNGKLTCTNSNPNIAIRPIIDSKFVRGVSVTESGGSYIYEFKPIVIGSTSIGADFLYKNAPIGSPYVQEIRIVPGNNPQSGTNLTLNFFPAISSLLGGENLTINVIDVKNSNVVTSAVLYINGQPYNTNQGSYTLKIERGLNYILRAEASGYYNYLINFSVNPTQITISVPDTVAVGESINLTSNVENITLTLDNAIITNPFNIASAGNHAITATKPGYISVSKNITAIDSNYVSFMTTQEDALYGNDLIIEFNRIVSWNIGYKKDASSEEKTILSNSSTIAKTKANKEGIYNFYYDGKFATSYAIEKTGSIFDSWLTWVIIIAVVAIILFIAIKARSSKGEEGDTTFEMGSGG